MSLKNEIMAVESTWSNSPFLCFSSLGPKRKNKVVRDYLLREEICPKDAEFRVSMEVGSGRYSIQNIYPSRSDTYFFTCIGIKGHVLVLRASLNEIQGLREQHKDYGNYHIPNTKIEELKKSMEVVLQE